MLKVVRAVTVAALALSLAACGKTKEQKAQDRAKSAAEEQHRLVAELNSLGAPTVQWSDEQLNAYEAKLNRLEAVEGELRTANGKNGITVVGADNSSFIAQARQVLAYVRAAKRSGSGAGSSPYIQFESAVSF